MFMGSLKYNKVSEEDSGKKTLRESQGPDDKGI